VCVCVCACVCVYVCVCVCLYAHCVAIDLNLSLARTSFHITHTSTQRAQKHVHTRTHAHTHTCKHTHKQTYLNAQNPPLEEPICQFCKQFFTGMGEGAGVGIRRTIASYYIKNTHTSFLLYTWCCSNYVWLNPQYTHTHTHTHLAGSCCSCGGGGGGVGVDRAFNTLGRGGVVCSPTPMRRGGGADWK
jgi:hypothetical protein